MSTAGDREHQAAPAGQGLAALFLAFALVDGVYQAGRALLYHKQGLDLLPDYAAARWFTTDPGARVYDRAALGAYEHAIGLRGPQGTDTIEFAYPPWLLVAYTPLSWLPWGVARRVWFALASVAGLGASALAGAAVAPSREARRRWAIAGVAMACMYFPFFYGLMAGQANDILLLCLSAALFFLRSKKPGCAGLALAPVALWKIFPGAVVVFLLARREWRALGGWAAGSAAIVLATLPFTGLRPWGEWLAYLPSAKGPAYAAFRNQSIAGAVQLLSSPGSDASPILHSASVAHGLTLCLQGLAIFLTWVAVRRPVAREDARYPVQYGAALLLGVLLMPQSWDHYGVYLLPAFLACVAAAPRPRLAVSVTLGAAFAVWAMTLQTHQEYAALGSGWRVLLLPAKLYASMVLLAVCAHLSTVEPRERA